MRKSADFEKNKGIRKEQSFIYIDNKGSRKNKCGQKLSSTDFGFFRNSKQLSIFPRSVLSWLFVSKSVKLRFLSLTLFSLQFPLVFLALLRKTISQNQETCSNMSMSTCLSSSAQENYIQLQSGNMLYMSFLCYIKKGSNKNK